MNRTADYCTVADVSAYLGTYANGQTTLNADHRQYAQTLITVAETYIDHVTRRSWNVGSINAERYNLVTSVVYLRYHPVTSVDLVQTRTTAVGDTLYTCIAGTDYELFDANLGQVNFQSGYHGYNSIALISYTPNLPVPTDISRACAMIAGNSMYLHLNPDRWGIIKAEFGQGAMVEYVDPNATLHITPEAQAIVDSYALPVWG